MKIRSFNYLLVNLNTPPVVRHCRRPYHSRYVSTRESSRRFVSFYFSACYFSSLLIVPRTKSGILLAVISHLILRLFFFASRSVMDWRTQTPTRGSIIHRRRVERGKRITLLYTHTHTSIYISLYLFCLSDFSADIVFCRNAPTFEDSRRGAQTTTDGRQN